MVLKMKNEILNNLLNKELNKHSNFIYLEEVLITILYIKKIKFDDICLEISPTSHISFTLKIKKDIFILISISFFCFTNKIAVVTKFGNNELIYSKILTFEELIEIN